MIGFLVLLSFCQVVLLRLSLQRTKNKKFLKLNALVCLFFIAAQNGNGYDNELSRTIFVDNIPMDVAKTPELLMDFFNAVGEVKFLRLASGRDSACQGVFVEFT